MAVTIEEAKAFIEDAKHYRESWLGLARKSWDEIKKRQKNNRLWSVTPNSLRKRARFPAWYSVFKIRQPLVLSRPGIPIGRDTTQDGSDNIGATAALCKERLAIGLAKAFNFFEVMCDCRDDFLVTNFSTCKAYYERDEIKQKVKEYIQPRPVPNNQGGQDVVFVDGEGNIVESDRIMQDDEGYFVEYDEIVDVDNEKICLKHILYSEVYIDPEVTRWEDVRRIAFATTYSYPSFRKIFGANATTTLPTEDRKDIDAELLGYATSQPKRKQIKVFEYWDGYEKDTFWFADNGTDFITPNDYMFADQEIEEEALDERNGIYDLRGFLPCPQKPLIWNQSTDEFWPYTEYFQVYDLIEDIHQIFSRIFVCTRAIRSRLLFDSTIEGLQAALNEAAEGDAIGIANLSQILARSGGNLANAVQYIPVGDLIEGLGQLYTALEQRLNAYYKLTGTSDLLQGLITDPTQRTFGERQMTEKYSLNQIAEPQRRMAEFVRDSYELLCEMALKNFKDSSLDMYIMPQTLPPEHQQNYKAAIGMLKEDDKRFRLELETDSTIALNEEYDKQVRKELGDTLAMIIDKAAAISQTNPALVPLELHTAKMVIQGLRQAKMFQQEITQAIDQVIQQSQNQPPKFDKDQAAAQYNQQKMQSDAQLRQMEIQSNAALKQLEVNSNEKIEGAKLRWTIEQEQQKVEQEKTITLLNAQLAQFKANIDANKSTAELQLQQQKLAAQINEVQEDLNIKRDALLVELRKITGAEEIAQFKAMTDQQVAAYEMQLQAAAHKLEEFNSVMNVRDKQMTDARVRQEIALAQSEHLLDRVKTAMEAAKPPEPAPVTINQAPQEPPLESYSKIVKDKFGNVLQVEKQVANKPVKKVTKVIRDEKGGIEGFAHSIVPMESPDTPSAPNVSAPSPEIE